MTLLLILGIVSVGVRRVRSSANPYQTATVAAIGVGLVVLAGLGWHRHELDRYRISLLGLRYTVADSSGRPSGRVLSVGGDRTDADLYLPGSTPAMSAYVSVTGTDSVEHVVLHSAADAGGAFLVTTDSGDVVLGQRYLTVNDTIIVSYPAGQVRLAISEIDSRFRPVQHMVMLDNGAVASAIELPAMSRTLWFRSGRSVMRRSYPLADVLNERTRDLGEGWGHLSSFLYYDANRLTLVDLDSEVVLRSNGAEVEPASLTIWAPGIAPRVQSARLALRDYPELDLTLPERYGIRPLRGFRVQVKDRWVDFYLEQPETYSLTAAELQVLTDPGARNQPYYRVRLSPASTVLLRRAVAFRLPAERFALIGAAVLELPRSASIRDFRVITPAGTGNERLGTPFPIGEASNASLLVRVDRFATSRRLWIALGALVILASSAFRPTHRAPQVPNSERAVIALALVVMGLLAIRLLLGLSASVKPPFSDESYELSLWLLPAVPWLILRLGYLGRNLATVDRVLPASTWAVPAAQALGLAGLSFLLFRGGMKAGVLALLPLSVLIAGWLPQATHRVRRWLEPTGRVIEAWPWPGVTLGLILFTSRFLLWLAGVRESIPLGERVAVSAFYTPLLMIGLALCLVEYARRTVSSEPERREAVVILCSLDLGMFLAFSVVAVSVLIGDFGIVLTMVPGLCVVLLLIALLWRARVHRFDRRFVMLVLPLSLFVLVQVDPSIVPSYPVTALAEDMRVQDWQRNELLLLERGDPGALRLIGQQRSEALAVMRETLRAYTRSNWRGVGYLKGRVSEEIRGTSVQEHAASALLVSEWGFFGALAMLGLLFALLAPIGYAGVAFQQAMAPSALSTSLLAVFTPALLSTLLPRPLDLIVLAAAGISVFVWLLAPMWRPRLKRNSTSLNADERSALARSDTDVWVLTGAGQYPFLAWLAVLTLFTVTMAGIYMVLANYGLVLFTGKNIYLFGLDSVSDALESVALLGLAAMSLGALVGTHSIPSGNST